MTPTVNGLSTAALMRRTGATLRQVDWWCTNGLIPETGNPGSGNHRRFTPEVVPLVATLVQVSKALACGTHGHISQALLVQVRDRLYDGYVELDNGVTLSWKVPS